MDIAKYIQQVFAPTGLIRICDEDSLALLPPRAGRFAKEVGLPSEEILLIRFERPRVITDSDGIRFTAVATSENDTLYAVGADESVREIDTANGYWSESRFVNTDLERLVGCLASYCAYVDDYGAKPEAIDEHAEKCIDRIREIDPAVFSSSETWWALVTEQMRYGFL